MKERWNNLNLTTKMLMVTSLTILATMLGLVVWLSGQMRADLISLLQVRSTVIQRQIEVTRAYIAKQYVGKVKASSGGTIKIAQDHSAPDTIPFPATATREMAEELSNEGIFNARVISSKPLNPMNKPNDAFEEEAIKALAGGEKEVVRIEPVNGVMTFRRMTPDIIRSEACVSCHVGTKVGDMVGAISLQMPMTKALAQVDSNVKMLYLAAGFSATLMGLVMFVSLRSQVIQPIRHLQTVVTSLTHGDLAARATIESRDEVGRLATSFNEMGDSLEQASAKQQEMVQQAQAAAAEVKSVTNAIGKAQAVIEFNLDGTVITANDNFLTCLGYQLNEIQGQHHRLFCDPAYTSTGEYAAFWQKLNRGEFDAGVYRRIGKGGKEIWIQASYNPILDVNGKPSKVMKFATDITAQKNQAAEAEGKISAIGKAQAAIEFNLDGTVMTANDNFLNCLGYTLPEIQGQHHRMFCDPAYTSTGEYAAFWQKLNRGEFDAGVYKRIGKGGKEIWIQASYNPIVDANGKVYKVVKFATDITPQKKAQAEMEHLVAEAQGVLGRLASNDLTEEMRGQYQGELAKIRDSINAVVHNLTQTMTTVREAVEAVTAGSEQISKGSEDLSQRTSEQASSLEETSASMEEMTSTVKQNADNAKQANQLGLAARDVAEKGGAVTKRAIDAMGEINQSSKKIADIITVIDEIAFQTNLLALNAAVEAARAGEHGRGFAVVAAEVRNLAQRSASAAKEIKGLINESIQRVNDGSALVNQSGQTLEEIMVSVKRVTDIISEITAASQEQASGIDQVNKAIMQMDETTQQNAALVEETTSASQSMKAQAQELMRQVEAFKVTVNGPGAKGEGPGTRVKAVAKPVVQKAAPQESPKPAGVASGNGHAAKKDEFEEF
ncbi:MAG: methyl-accepting chemotaxis protein [Nitrospira sp.]|jgi:methyl-accepting chemotaxis protein|nr:methyl-accepting chemotaxis protein [Nitrospira sp.]